MCVGVTVWFVTGGVVSLCRLKHWSASACIKTAWIKIDQLDVTCFIISLFTVQHVSNVITFIFRSLLLIMDLSHVLYSSGLMCVGVTVWFGWCGVVSLRRLKHWRASAWINIAWIMIDNLDVAYFIISLFTAQHVSNIITFIFRSLRLIVDLSHGLYCSVIIEVLALASLFSGECLVMTCVVVLMSVFL